MAFSIRNLDELDKHVWQSIHKFSSIGGPLLCFEFPPKENLIRPLAKLEPSQNLYGLLYEVLMTWLTRMGNEQLAISRARERKAHTWPFSRCEKVYAGNTFESREEYANEARRRRRRRRTTSISETTGGNMTAADVRPQGGRKEEKGEKDFIGAHLPSAFRSRARARLSPGPASLHRIDDARARK